jgi:hypothetical protein
LDRIASGGTGAGHGQINQLLRASATSFRRCKHKLQLLRKQVVTQWSQRY